MRRVQKCFGLPSSTQWIAIARRLDSPVFYRNRRAKANDDNMHGGSHHFHIVSVPFLAARLLRLLFYSPKTKLKAFRTFTRPKKRRRTGWWCRWWVVFIPKSFIDLGPLFNRRSYRQILTERDSNQYIKHKTLINFDDEDFFCYILPTSLVWHIW